jgi:hypothetical protein
VRQRQMQLEVAGGRAETWQFLAKSGLDSQKIFRNKEKMRN